MGSICDEQSHRHHHHKFHHLSASNKIHHHLYGLNIPPRKLSYCGTVSSDTALADFSSDSLLPKQAADKTSAPMQKILPCNGDSNSEDGFDRYSSDQFRMFEFKVRRCARSRSHDWTDCPFAHPGEKARRRDPRKYHYSSTVCPEYRHGGCGRGDDCEYAHGVFECWLHPTRYRTEMCKDGKNCKRKVCFFAHSSRELRIFLSQRDSESREGSRYKNSTIKNITDHCCGYCSCSPTSTLLGMSHFSPPSLSPPVTPVKAAKGLSGSLSISRMGDWIAREGLCGAVTGCSAPVLDELALRGLSYKDALNELMESFDGVNLNDFSWVNDLFNYDGDDHQQFVLSSSTPNTSGSTRKISSFTANSCDFCSNNNIAINFDDKCNDSGLSGPDLGWVDDLLM